MGPNTAFLLLVFGVLAIEFEFLRPGRIVPGLAGVGLTITSLASLWRHSPTRTGIVLLVGAVLFLAIEALWNAHFVPGILGSVGLTVGFVRLFPSPRSIAAGLAIAGSVVLGGTTMFLIFGARKARQNKQPDL